MSGLLDLECVELFPCSGGFAEGFRRGGVVFKHAFDYSADACDSYEKNHGHRPIHMDVNDLVRLVEDGWRPGGVLDLLVADPPCTPWSRAGKRQGLDDERDMMRATCRLIELLRPRAFLIGNVPGLEDRTSWGAVQKTIGPLAKVGYCVRDFVTLDAADFGVPQHRIRPFWFGHLDGPCIRWPAPTHCDPRIAGARLDGVELKAWVSCRQALGHLSPEDLGRPVRLRKRNQHSPQHGSLPEKPARVVGTSNLSDGNVLLEPSNKHPAADLDGLSPTIRSGGGGHSGPQVLLRTDSRGSPSTADAPAKTVTTNEFGEGAILVENPRHRPVTPDELAPTIGAKDRGQLTVRPHHAVPGPDDVARTQTTRQDDGRVIAWPWDRPSTTVCARDTIPPPGHHPEEGSILSMPGAVLLSEKAATILQGFPETWVFSGRTKRARWAQLGMAMPPALAHAVALAVVEQARRARQPLEVANG